MKQFELTENHIKLLNHMYVYWDDGAYDGAPAINSKRPYGNSSVAYDVYEIIHGKEWDYPNDDEMPEKLYEQMLSIHRETATALQIVLYTKSFEPGIYKPLDSWDRRTWVKVKQKKTCKNQDEGGNCPLHNLHCQYPDCLGV